MLFILTTALISFVLGIVYSSFFEWTLHRFLMHRPFVLLKYPFRAHAITHHSTFGAGDDYHLQKPEDRKVVRMAWWNAPALLALNAPVALLAAWAVGSWWVVPGFVAAFAFYYGMYEYLHWCFHVPNPQRWFQETAVYRWIDRHHRLHHLRPHRNLNVVLPIADFCLRTRIAG